MTDEHRPLTPQEIEKVEAETERIKVETRNAESQGARNEAEAEKLRAEARAAKAQAEVAEIMASRERRKEEDELTSDKHHHRYVFDDVVTDQAVNKCILQLTTWTRKTTEPITVELVLNSPGGNIIAGFALIDFIIALQAEGHTINTKTLGMAASMAGVILQVGNERVMGKHSVLLIHEASFGAAGSYGEIKDQVKLVDMMHERILDLFTARSKVTKRFIKGKWNRTDWWISASDALKFGFIDRIQ